MKKNESIKAIILAAGKGTRMNSELPKCAIDIKGKPMVQRIIDSCTGANVDDIIVVVGYKREILINSITTKVTFAVQEVQNGTGHACLSAEKDITNFDGITLVLPGDTPLIDKFILTDLIENHKTNNNDMTVVSVIKEVPGHYGRIVRSNNEIDRIVEYKDATDIQKTIKEVNSGIYCFNTKVLFEKLKLITNHNAQNEFYLTDLVEILNKDYKVGSIISNNENLLLGVNCEEDLEKILTILNN